MLPTEDRKNATEIKRRGRESVIRSGEPSGLHPVFGRMLRILPSSSVECEAFIPSGESAPLQCFRIPSKIGSRALVYVKVRNQQ